MRSQALGAKRAILSAPTYHFYRASELLASFAGAMPNRLVELIEEHRGEETAKRGGRKLLALLGVLLAGGALLAFSNARSSQPAPALPVPSSPPPKEEAAAEASAQDAAPPADAAEPARELQASGPSKGARHEQ